MTPVARRGLPLESGRVHPRCVHAMWVKHVVRGEAYDQATCLLENRLEAALVGMAGDRWSRLKTAPLWRAVGAGGLRAMRRGAVRCWILCV